MAKKRYRGEVSSSSNGSYDDSDFDRIVEDKCNDSDFAKFSDSYVSMLFLLLCKFFVVMFSFYNSFLFLYAYNVYYSLVILFFGIHLFLMSMLRRKLCSKNVLRRK